MAYTGFITISTDAPSISEQSVVGEGASLLSNPKLLDDRARFNLIDTAPGIIRYDAGDTGASTRWNCIVTKGENGAPLYVRVGAGGAIESSPDAVTWTSQTSGVSVMLNFVIYDSFTAAYWVVGESGTMLKSTDGITWGTVSLPAVVATHNLTGIATDGAGVFVVSNGSSGNNQLTSTDSGANWSVTNAGVGAGGFTVAYLGGTFFIGRNNATTNRRQLTYSSNVAGDSWVRVDLGSGNEIIYGIVDDGVNRIAVGSSGFVATNPRSSSPDSANWTVRSSGVASSLRPMLANGRVYVFGSSGVSLVSMDHGETWQSGPPVGVTSFLRYGVVDPHNPTRALIVGDSGVTLFGQYPFYIICYESDTDRTNRGPELGKVQEAYVDTPKRVVVPGLLEIDVGSVFP